MIAVPPDLVADRLDRFLTQQLPDLSRSRLQKLIESGLVCLNDRVCDDKKTLVKSGDRLTIEIPAAKPLDLIAQSIPLDILYEDEHLLVINKPAGLVVHPAPGHEDGTLVNALLAHCQISLDRILGDRTPELDELEEDPNLLLGNNRSSSSLSGINGVQRPGIVHRLDKDTSGAIVVAKTDQAHQHLQAQIQAKTARREYLGIVHGIPKMSSGTIVAPIGRHRNDRKKMAVVADGRPAITHWQVQEVLRNFSLLKFDLETGRTHQIRVHAAHMGHAIANDPVYSPNAKAMAKQFAKYLTGQALHAWRLTFTHPVSGEAIEAIAPLPEGFERLLKHLRN
ncbi:RluA family pseudouridine synthase [Tumidithrix helvetica]|uniref:RluA family pseudouridine synthase n=1 Tax=Tumidithrix helvetica TaxID=3457545 RepID=UPI003CC6750E